MLKVGLGGVFVLCIILGTTALDKLGFYKLKIGCTFGNGTLKLGLKFCLIFGFCVSTLKSSNFGKPNGGLSFCISGLPGLNRVGTFRFGVLTFKTLAVCNGGWNRGFTL
jgi:hypothetical protein